MSEHKQLKSVHAGVNTGMTVRNASFDTRDGRKPAYRQSQARLLGVVVLVFVILATGVWYVFWRPSSKPLMSTGSNVVVMGVNTGGSKVLTAADFQQVQTNANTLDYSGHYADAQKMLDNSIAQTTDRQQLAALYLLKASHAYYANHITDSLQYAQKSESLSPSAGSARFIAMSAQQLGDKAMAIKYYQLLLNRESNVGPAPSGDVPGIESQIKELEG
jgi:tetratricopeptide (TPR) repeat protein